MTNRTTTPLVSLARLCLAGAGTVVVATTTLACSDGQLAQTTLTPPCAAGDTTCQETGAIQSPIAAGASFAIEVKPKIVGGLAVPITLSAVDESVASIDEEGRVVGVGPGISAVLILADDGSVVDFTHVAVAKAERLSFHRGAGGEIDERQLPESMQMFPDEELTLSLRVWQQGQQLIGDMGDRWTVAGDSGGFVLVDQGFALERVIKAPAQGTATITVEAVGVSQTITLEVAQ